MQKIGFFSIFVVLSQIAGGATLCSNELMSGLEGYGTAIYSPKAQEERLALAEEWDLSTESRRQLALARGRLAGSKSNAVMVHLRGDLDHGALAELIRVVLLAKPQHDPLSIGRTAGNFLLISLACITMTGCNAWAYHDSAQPLSWMLGWATAGIGVASWGLMQAPLARERLAQEQQDVAALKGAVGRMLTAFVAGRAAPPLPRDFSDAVQLRLVDPRTRKSWQLLLISRVSTQGEPESLILQDGF
jgi:hypothetical protein